MRHSFIIALFASCACLFAKAQDKAQDSWDLVYAYNASSHVFYGEISKIIPEPNFPTGAMGVNIEKIEGDALVMEAIVWPRAKEFTFSVQEYFKEPMVDTFAVYRADPVMDLWTYVENETGDVFLAKPEAVNPIIEKLVLRDRGLFFIRYYLGSNIRIIYRARFGQSAQDDLARLRAHESAGNVSLELIVQQARATEAVQAKRKAAEFKVFEDDYYKILRIQDFDIRSSLLNDLIVRIGFEGRWTYFDYKERYIKAHGSHVDDSAIPAPPYESKEKLWQDISAELKKIEVVQKARK